MGHGVWRSMHKRCNDPKTNGYKWYGAKGITVDPSWDNFFQFHQDMGFRPSVKHHLDRVDSNKGYSKDNCQWITSIENYWKKDSTNLIERNNEVKPMSVWAKELGFSMSTFQVRIQKWGIELAFTKPHGLSGPKPKRDGSDD